MPEVTHNIDNGYLEGLVRGFKAGIIKQTDYLNLVQCETLEGKNPHGATQATIQVRDQLSDGTTYQKLYIFL